MNAEQNRCRCGCGAPEPCPWDARYPVIAEYRRLVDTGVPATVAKAQIAARVDPDDVKKCPQCSRWFLSSRANRTICADCKESRREERDQGHGRKRTKSGADVARKARDRAIAKAPPHPSTVNREVDEAIRSFGSRHAQRDGIGLDHVGRFRRDPKRRRSLTAWFRRHGLLNLAARVRAAARLSSKQ